jgi:hypothetical protein
LCNNAFSTHREFLIQKQLFEFHRTKRDTITRTRNLLETLNCVLFHTLQETTHDFTNRDVFKGLGV